MDKKNIAAVVTTTLCALLFIVIGSTFSAFVYKKEIIKVENPNIIIADQSNISVFDEKGEKNINLLKLSDMKLGLKPATGEEDAVTNIPTTVTEKQGSEGVYAKFKVLAPDGAKIVVSNIQIESREKVEDIQKERENIMISIKGLVDSTHSLKGDRVELGVVSASSEKQEFIFFVWLSAKTSDKLESSKISFDINFESNS